MKTSNIQMFPNGLVIHHYTLPIPGIRKKIIYQFSDTHLCLADDLSSEEEAGMQQKEAPNGSASAKVLPAAMISFIPKSSCSMPERISKICSVTPYPTATLSSCAAMSSSASRVQICGFTKNR